MRKTVLFLFLQAWFFAAQAQDTNEKPFQAYLYNMQYNVYMQINFHDCDVVIDWEEMLGPQPGYLVRKGYSYCWIVTDARITDNKADIEMINDYGSDDLEATLIQENDSVYTLKQKSGSTIKVPNNGKMQKLPSVLTFIKRK